MWERAHKTQLFRELHEIPLDARPIFLLSQEQELRSSHPTSTQENGKKEFVMKPKEDNTTKPKMPPLALPLSITNKARPFSVQTERSPATKSSSWRPKEWGKGDASTLSSNEHSGRQTCRSHVERPLTWKNRLQHPSTYAHTHTGPTAMPGKIL